MNDIYDIKDTLFWLPINVTNTLIFIIFIIILFFMVKILFKKEEQIEEIVEQKIEKKEKRNYLDILNEFEKDYIDSKSDVFFSKLLEIIREILDVKENKNISKMTFEEINFLKIDNDLKKLIKDIYFKEYSKYVFDDNSDYRKDLISKVKEII